MNKKVYNVCYVYSGSSNVSHPTHPTAKVQNLHHCITSLLVIVLGFWRANILYFVLVDEQKFSSGGEPMRSRSRSGVEHFDRQTKRLKWRPAFTA